MFSHITIIVTVSMVVHWKRTNKKSEKNLIFLWKIVFAKNNPIHRVNWLTQKYMKKET